MKSLLFWFSLAVFLLTISGCSSNTKLTGSWKDPGYNRRIDRVYIIGVSKQEMHRRLFEDEFASHLLAYGVTSIPSYKDLTEAEATDRTMIDSKLRDNRADTLLIARVLGQRTEEVIHPGHTPYSTWPYYGPSRYWPAPYYRDYWSYYDHRYDMIYVPATVSRYQVITAECNLYDAKSGSLIWSAQLETVVENDFQERITGFIETVTRSLSEEGLL
jgi:hypothetical protein